MNLDFKELEALKLLIEKYFKAVYEADVPTLKEIFHEKASMNGYLGDMLLVGTPEPFFADLSSKPSMAETKIDCRMVIKSINCTGKIANVVMKVDGFYGVACIEDMFHLIKENDEWKIVCKTFTTL